MRLNGLCRIIVVMPLRATRRAPMSGQGRSTSPASDSPATWNDRPRCRASVQMPNQGFHSPRLCDIMSRDCSKYTMLPFSTTPCSQVQPKQWFRDVSRNCTALNINCIRNVAPGSTCESLIITWFENDWVQIYTYTGHQWFPFATQTQITNPKRLTKTLSMQKQCYALCVRRSLEN